MRVQTLVVATIFSLAMVGCAGTAGNQKLSEQSQQSISQNIVEGKTTQAQVKSLLGEPTQLSYTDAGNEIYTYSFSRATAQGVNYIPIINLFARGFDVNTKKLVILFDKNQVVTKSTMSESQSETRGGIGQ